MTIDRTNRPALRRALAVAGALALTVVVAACGADGEEDEAWEPTTPLQEQTAEVTLVAPEGEDPQVLPPYSAGMDDAAIGQTIPTVTGTSLLTGEPMTIGPEGGPKLIVFLAHWCPHCQREVPRVSDHLADNPLPDGVELVAVSTSVRDNAPNHPPQRWLEREGWPAETMADSAVGIAAQVFGLGGLPYFVAVDADGTVVARASGEKSTEQFDALVEAALTGSPVSGSAT